MAVQLCTLHSAAVCVIEVADVRAIDCVCD